MVHLFPPIPPPLTLFRLGFKITIIKTNDHSNEKSLSIELKNAFKNIEVPTIILASHASKDGSLPLRGNAIFNCTGRRSLFPTLF